VVVLITFLSILSILSRTGVPWFLKLMISLLSQVKINRGAKAVHIFSPSNCIEFISSRTFFAVIVMIWLLCISHRQMNYTSWQQLHSACYLLGWVSATHELLCSENLCSNIEKDLFLILINCEYALTCDKTCMKVMFRWTSIGVLQMLTSLL